MRNLFGTQGPPGWLVTGGLASIALGYLFLAFFPSQRAIGTMRDQLREKQQQIEKSGELAATLVDFQQQLVKTEEIVTKWKQAAPAPTELSQVYAQVSDRARQSNVRILRLDPQPLKEYGLVIEHSVTVSVEGTFEGLFRFLQGVEGLPHTTWTRTMSIQRASEMSEDLRCDVTLTIFGDLAD